MMMAIRRIVRGLVGMWCIFGPVMLIFGHSQLSGGALAMMAVLVLIFYMSLVWKWRRQGLGFVKSVAKDTALLVLFVLVGSAISGVVAAFGGPALHTMGVFTLAFPFLGFGY